MISQTKYGEIYHSLLVRFTVVYQCSKFVCIYNKCLKHIIKIVASTVLWKTVVMQFLVSTRCDADGIT